MPASARRSPRLPAELTLQIMKHLPQSDLRIASQASRDFYGLALAAGLYIQRTLFWTPRYGFSTRLEQLDRILDRASSKPALNIAIMASFRSSIPAMEPVEKAVQRFAVSLQRAMPYVVRLDLRFHSPAPSAVYTSLCAHPASRLSVFEIDNRLEGSQRIPQDLFMGHAPLLRKLSLALANGESLSMAASFAVFQRVTHLKLFMGEAQHPVPLARIFPSLQVLALECPRGVEKIDLSGLRLRYLGLTGGAGLLADASVLRTIPVVEHRAVGIDTVWPAQCDAICAHAEYFREMIVSLSFGPRDGAWRRTVALQSPNALDHALPLAEIAANLVSITLDRSLVTAFVQAPVVLPALRELFLDISANGSHGSCWPPVDSGLLGPRVRFDELTPSVRCPALARVIIFAIPSGHPVTVVPTKATRFGRALGLRDGRTTKPTIVLAGCTFNMEPIWPALDELFATVEIVACTGDRIPEYYRTCRYSGSFGPHDRELLDV
ncbi:hypothetical protein AURDEDRAFT_176084 [Auricularia subglabra TFB-10046 SS5]|nr:hypothetical protein AURDEDRAFT_176084 [Auricularia subglabra TFB-10046 SS5]